jgi:hypothetical protein
MDRCDRFRSKALLVWALGLLAISLAGGLAGSAADAALPPNVDVFVTPGQVKVGDWFTVIMVNLGGPITSCTLSFDDQTMSGNCSKNPQTYMHALHEGTFAVKFHGEGPGGACDRSATVKVSELGNPTPPAPTYSSWSISYVQLFENEETLEMFRKYRDEFLARTNKGKLYTDVLYENSENALQVLLDNPDLIVRAKNLLQANQAGIQEVLNGRKAVVNNPDEIVAFLDDFAGRSSATLNVLAKMVKREMLQQFKLKKPFIGFTRQ